MKLRCAGTKRQRRLSDQHVRKLVIFQNALTRKPDQRHEARVARRWPALYGAFDTAYRAPESFRAKLEARILAGEPHEAIACKLFLRSEVVSCYEAAFFHVSDRFQAKSWITHFALGGNIHAIENDGDLGVLTRFYGYWCGPAMVDVLAHACAPDRRASTPADAESALADSMRAVLACKAALAARALDIMNPKTITIARRIIRSLESSQQRLSSTDTARLHEAVREVYRRYRHAATCAGPETAILLGNTLPVAACDRGILPMTPPTGTTASADGVPQTVSLGAA